MGIQEGTAGKMRLDCGKIAAAQEKHRKDRSGTRNRKTKNRETQ
jgi:hypothetical protein